MAQGDPWQMGVLSEDFDSRFRAYDKFAYLLNDEAVTGAGKTLETADGDAAALDIRSDPYNVGVDSVVILGPSTYTGHEGATEEFTVTAISATAITGTLVYKYSARDKITIRTTPRAWIAEDTVDIPGKRYSRADGLMFGNGTADLDIGYGCAIRRGTQTDLSFLTADDYMLDEDNPVTVSPSINAQSIGDVGATSNHAIIKFDLSSLSGHTVKRAILKIVYTNCGGDGVREMQISYIKRNWQVSGNSPSWNNYDNGVAWATAGGTGAADSADAGGRYAPPTPTASGTASFVLTNSIVQQMIDGGITNYGFLVWAPAAASTTFINTDNPAVATLELITSDASDDTHLIQVTSGINTVEELLKYRASYYFKSSGNYEECFLARTEKKSDGTTVVGSSDPLTEEQSSYTLQSWIFTTSAGTTKALWAFKIEAGITQETIFTVTNFVVEHAKGTSDASAGFLTLDKNPGFDSIRPQLFEGEKDNVLPNNVLDSFDPSDNRVRWGLVFEFRGISLSQYDDLVVMHNHSKGKFIVLRTHLNFLPQVMIGKFRLVNPYSRTPSFSKVSVPARFIVYR